MDFCSVKIGITKKAMEIASKEVGFEKISDNSFKGIDASFLNEQFGGDVALGDPELTIIKPSDRVVNSYIYEANKDRIETLKNFEKEIKGVYKYSYEADPEQFLFEIAIQSHSSESEREGALNAVGRGIVAIADALYPEAKVGSKLSDFRFDVHPLQYLQEHPSFYSLSQTGDYKILQKSILAFVRNNIKAISRYDFNGVERYYFTRKDPYNPSRIESMNDFEEFMNIHNFDEDMFNYGKTKEGFPYIEINQNYKPLDKLSDKIERSVSNNKKSALIHFLGRKFGIESKIKLITKEEFKQRFKPQYKENMNSAVSNGFVYIFPRATNEIVGEELLHPFIETLFQFNSKLFNNLLEEAKKNFPKLAEEIKHLYANEHLSVQQKELVTQALSRVFLNLLEKEEAKPLNEVISKLTEWIRSVFNDLLTYFGIDRMKVISPEDFSLFTTLEDLARVINTTDTAIDVVFPEGTFYNKSGESLVFTERIKKILEDKKVDTLTSNILSNIPQTIRDIRNKLSTSINQKERNELTSLINSLYETAGKENYLHTQLSTIIKVINVFNVLESENNAFNDDPNRTNDEKLAFAMSTYKTSETLNPFVDMMTELYNELNETIGKDRNNPDIVNFYNILNNAISIKKKINDGIIKKLKGPTLEELVKYTSPYYQGKVDALNSEIKILEAKQLTATGIEKGKISARIGVIIREKEKIAKNAPTRENLEKIFNSEFRDANKLSRMFESGIANGHPLVQSFISMIDDINLEAERSTIENRNILQQAIDDLTTSENKSKRDMGELYDPIIEQVLIPTGIEEKDGKREFIYVSQNSLLGDYDTNYITQYLEHKILIDFLYNKFGELKKKNEDTVELQAELKKAYKDFSEFKKENVQARYKDKVYDMYAILDTPVRTLPDGTIQTLNEVTNNYYQLLEQHEHELTNVTNTEDRLNLQNSIKNIKAELRNLRNPYDKFGKEKVGEAKNIADLLTEFNKLKYEYGEYKITPEGEKRYELDLQVLEEQFQKGAITQEQYENIKSNITKNTIDPTFFELLKKSGEEITKTFEEILKVMDAFPELEKNFDPKLKELSKESYKKIQALVKDYRDDEGIIDGTFMQTAAPESVTIIKNIQQAIENLKYQAGSLKDISKAEKNKIRDYELSGDTLNDEYVALKAKQASVKDFYNVNKDLIDYYNELHKKVGEFSKGSNTTYYDEEVANQLSILKNSEEIKEKAINEINTISEESPMLTIGKNRYFRKGFYWYQQLYINKQFVDKSLFDPTDAKDTGFEVVLNASIANFAQASLESTEWWNKNHYTKYNYDKNSRSYIAEFSPIYIWQTSTPTDPAYILNSEPANVYKKYTLKPENINEDYTTIYKGVEAPKKGKFSNDKISKLTPGYQKFLSTARAVYSKSQEYLPETDKMGNVLPSIIKTEGENEIAFTNNVLKWQLGDIMNENFGVTDDDNSLLLGGSQTNQRIVPKRFINVMDSKRQTKNIPAALLLFDYHASVNNKMNQALPKFEAIELMANSVTATHERSVVDKLTVMQRIKKLMKGDKNTTSPELDPNNIKETELGTTITGFLNMFVYGQLSKPALVNLGPLGVFDLKKGVGQISAFVGKTVFVGNLLSAINNSVSTRIQTIVQSGILSSLYNFSDITKAQSLAPKYSKDLLSDWTKVGNKSLIGQVLDYFGFNPEGVQGDFTSKTEFTIIKNKMEFLTSAKAISEFEVLFLQFLTMANATNITKNGQTIKLSNIEEIFELKDNKVQLKDGVVFSKQQEFMFIKSFKKMARDIGGAYRGSEKTQAETEWWGHAAMFMHKFFVPMLANRYGGERWSIEQQRVVEGFYRSTFKNLISLYKDYSFNITKQWANLTDDEKIAYKRTSIELSMIIAVAVALSLMGGWDDKKKLKENSWFYNTTLAVLFRAQSEVEAFNFMFGWNELIRMSRTPFVATSSLANIYKVFSLIPDTVMQDEQAFYKTTNGLHKKGDSKLVSASLKAFIGYSGNTFAPEEYIINFRNSQKNIR